MRSAVEIPAAARQATDRLISKEQALNQPPVVEALFKAKLVGLGHECAAVAYLDHQFRLIRYMGISQGTISQASVWPREVVKTGLRLNASAIIMAHNPPSGSPTPSQADITLTRYLNP